MAADNRLFKLVNVEQDVIRPGDLLIEMGTDAFDVSATAKEVTTQLTTVDFALVQAVDATPVAGDFCTTDKTVTSSAVTVGRPSNGTASLPFNFIFIGRKVV